MTMKIAYLHRKAYDIPDVKAISWSDSACASNEGSGIVGALSMLTAKHIRRLTGPSPTTRM
jgi:hypothetical protein